MKPSKPIKSVQESVLSKIIRGGRGAIFFGEGFLSLGNPEAVRQTLSRLTRRGTIRRIGTSLYYYPAFNSHLGGELPPSADLAAQAIAKRTDSRIVATGALAANLLGLSTQVPAKRIYLTNGPSRNLSIGTHLLSFRHVSPRRMAARGKISALVFEAIKYLRQKEMTEEVVSRLQHSLPVTAKAQLLKDLKHSAIWMRPILKRIIEGKG
mgnify:CR=1 FL=1|jgi:hypothetical protein